MPAPSAPTTKYSKCWLTVHIFEICINIMEVPQNRIDLENIIAKTFISETQMEPKPPTWLRVGWILVQMLSRLFNHGSLKLG